MATMMSHRLQINLISLAMLVLLCGCPVYPDVDPPEPEPEPSPIAVDSLKVLIVEETSRPQDRPSYLFKRSFREAVGQAGAEFRLHDKDADLSKAPQWIKDAMALERESLPWLIVASPKGAFVGPLPSDESEVLGHIGDLK